MSTWYALRDEYLVYLRSLGRSQMTLETARRWLDRLIDFCQHDSIEWPATFTAVHMERFRDWLCWAPGLKGHLYSQRTVDIALRMARGMFTWATRRERVLVNPSERLVLGRVRTPPLRPLPVEDVEKLLRTPDESTASGLRDRAVLEMLYSTGLRRSECEQLNVNDLDLDGRAVRIHGKGGEERLAPVGEKLAAVLDVYLREARPSLLAGAQDPRWRHHARRRPADSNEPALFLSLRGTRYLGESIAQLVRMTAREAGLEHVTTHGLRRAFATHLLEGGADFLAVQQLMGHKVPQSTQTYTYVSREEVHRVHRETHPRARRLTPQAVVKRVEST